MFNNQSNPIDQNLYNEVISKHMSNNFGSSKVLLDSGDPIETIEAIKLLGKLDGQTTNPSLVAKSSRVVDYVNNGNKFSEAELIDVYKEIIKEISVLIPDGSVSIEVYADKESTAKDLLKQAEIMYTWIPNAHIKFPTIKAGLVAAETFVKSGGRVNMTLVFNQRQAQAVHLATTSLASSGDVFISPFIGRLDDLGLNGLDAVFNIQKYFAQVGSKVQVLAASIRHKDHIKACIDNKVDILTLPLTAIKEWVETESDFTYSPNPNLEHIPYLDLEHQETWEKVDIYHELTSKGLDKFASDWTSLLKS